MRRNVAVILSIIMLASILTSCQPASPTESSPTETAETQETAETVETQESGDAKFGSPEEPIVVTYLCKDLNPTDQDVIDYCDQLYENMAAQGMYIKLEVLEAPTGTYAEVVPLAVRTGQLSPDIVYFQGGDLAVSQEGLLEDLTPYIESSTNVKSLMEDYAAARIASYPYLLEISNISVATPAIRSDIFAMLETGEALINDPTIDNYYAMMKEIKDKDLADYVITTDGGITRLDSIFNQAFGITGTIMKVDDKWVYGKTTEFERNKLEFYAKLYAEGILDAEYITKGWEAMEQAFYTGESAMIAGTCGAVINIYNTKIIAEQGEAAVLMALPPATGVDQSFMAIDITKNSRGRTILSTSEVKDAAWAVMEYMASPEGRMLDLLGVEGVHYNIENGQIVTTDRFGGWWSRFYGSTYHFEPEPPLAEPLMSDPALDTLEMAQKYAKNDINIIVPDDLMANWDAMNAIYNDYSADIIRGIRPISDFDKMVEEWNAAGGDAFAEYLAAELD